MMKDGRRVSGLAACVFFEFEDFPAPCQKPSCGNPVFIHEISQPRRLKNISGWVFFKTVQIPPVYFKPCCKRLFSPNYLFCFQILKSLKETLYYFLTVFCLHNSSDFAAAAANLSFISFILSSALAVISESVSGLKAACF